MRTFAPGKLVLLGEYAVLDGCPALAIAVSNGVLCEVEPADALQILTPDGDDRFVRAALLAVQAPAARYRFTTAKPLDLPDKPGLGGSAAAVIAALLAGGCEEEELRSTGLGVHYQVQGSGSGVDIAVAATGGGIRYSNGNVERMELPVPVVVYAGRSAKTGPRVERYRAWRDRRHFVADSRELVHQFLDDPITTTQYAWELLVEMARQTGISYSTPAIESIVALAVDHGGAAKPSGAGGGDVVIAWVDDPGSLKRDLSARGFPVLDVELSGPPTVDDGARTAQSEGS